MGHLLFLDIASGVHDVRMLQIAHPEVIPHGIRCEGLLRVLFWVSFDLPAHLKGMVGALLRAAGEGNTELHTVTIQGRDIRDFFFWTAPSAFRLVTNFEAYLRTSGESNHHRKFVRVVERHRPTNFTTGAPRARHSRRVTQQ